MHTFVTTTTALILMGSFRKFLCLISNLNKLKLVQEKKVLIAQALVYEKGVSTMS